MIFCAVLSGIAHPRTCEIIFWTCNISVCIFVWCIYTNISMRSVTCVLFIQSTLIMFCAVFSPSTRVRNKSLHLKHQYLYIFVVYLWRREARLSSLAGLTSHSALFSHIFRGSALRLAHITRGLHLSQRNIVLA